MLKIHQKMTQKMMWGSGRMGERLGFAISNLIHNFDGQKIKT
jgi:hypothetical protein